MKRSLCILLVEDDRVLGPMTHELLLYLGHQAVLAPSAPAAYRHLSARHASHLVVLDLELGDERSEPLIHRLRAEGATLPPIIIFSALPFNEVAQAVRDIGAQGFVRKPASMGDIHYAIERAVA